MGPIQNHLDTQKLLHSTGKRPDAPADSSASFNVQDGVQITGANAPPAKPQRSQADAEPVRIEVLAKDVPTEIPKGRVEPQEMHPERARITAKDPEHAEQPTVLPWELRFSPDTNTQWSSNTLSIHGKEEGYTELHMRMTSECANRFAAALDGTPYALLPAEKTALEESGNIYDMGKLAIDDKILMNPGKPSDEERKQINRHVLVRTNRFPDGGDPEIEKLFVAYPERGSKEGVREIVRHHHERWDGKGYPDGLKGHDIPLTAQIVGIADMWDSITTKRPWRDAKPFEAAKGMMLDMADKGQFNPELVALFFERVDLQQIEGQRDKFRSNLKDEYRWNLLKDANDTEILLGPGYVDWESVNKLTS